MAGQLEDMVLAMEAKERAAQVIRVRNEELTEQLLKTDRKYQKERVKPRWGSTLAWGMAAGFGAAFTGTLAYAILD